MNREAQALIDDILNNRDTTAELTKEQIMEYQNKVNFYGIVVPGDESWANLSIVNWRDEYLRKLITTAMIGYIYRTFEEYEDYEYPDELKEYMSEEDIKRVLKNNIGKFLRRNFNYNPDRHVASAYKENLADPERAGKYAEMREKMKEPDSPEITEQSLNESAHLTYSQSLEAAEKIKKVLTDLREFSASNPFADPVFRAAIYDLYLRMKDDPGANKTIVRTLERYFSRDEELDTTDLQVFLARAEDKLLNVCRELQLNVSGLKDIKGPYVWIPPVDVFHHFNRYLTNHYEQVREACQILYCEKPDIEFGIQYYNSYDTKKDAEDNRRSIQDKVTVPVFTIKNEEWTILGPFKENRERVDFYNKNTEIIKKMIEQAEMDQRLGMDLMKKRVRVQKEKNIIEAGPDDPGLEQYQKALGTIENLGAKKVLSREEKEELAEAVRRKEMTEVPPDAIQVDVFKTDDDGKMVKDKFYTQAEAPEFMNDQLAEQRRAYGHAALQERVNEKMVTSRRGSEGRKVTSLDQLRQNVQPENRQ